MIPIFQECHVTGKAVPMVICFLLLVSIIVIVKMYTMYTWALLCALGSLRPLFANKALEGH